MAADGVTAKQM